MLHASRGVLGYTKCDDYGAVGNDPVPVRGVGGYYRDVDRVSRTLASTA